MTLDHKQNVSCHQETKIYKDVEDLCYNNSMTDQDYVRFVGCWLSWPQF